MFNINWAPEFERYNVYSAINAFHCMTQRIGLKNVL